MEFQEPFSVPNSFLIRPGILREFLLFEPLRVVSRVCRKRALLAISHFGTNHCSSVVRLYETFRSPREQYFVPKANVGRRVRIHVPANETHDRASQH
jgi:hypothetical protein